MCGIGVRPGDDVICPARSFSATAMCIVRAGGTPVFADVDPTSGCVTADTLEAARTANTRAAIVVHLGGWPCDMPAILEWASQHDILIVEDCAQAHGGSIDGRHVGTFGQAAVWSFCNDKILTTGGEGGMLATSDQCIWKRAWSFGEHGKGFDAAQHASAGPSFQWLVEHAGTNLRMTEMQAAIGRSQLTSLGEWVEARQHNMAILHKALRLVDGVRAPAPPPGHAGYRYTVYLRHSGQDLATLRQRILRTINAQGWPADSGSCPDIQREPFFKSMSRPRSEVPVATALGESSMSFLVHPTIDRRTMHRYTGALAEAIEAATRAVETPCA
jgi:hypothetical protein